MGTADGFCQKISVCLISKFLWPYPFCLNSLKRTSKPHISSIPALASHWHGSICVCFGTFQDKSSQTALPFAFVCLWLCWCLCVSESALAFFLRKHACLYCIQAPYLVTPGNTYLLSTVNGLKQTEDPPFQGDWPIWTVKLKKGVSGLNSGFCFCESGSGRLYIIVF